MNWWEKQKLMDEMSSEISWNVISIDDNDDSRNENKISRSDEMLIVWFWCKKSHFMRSRPDGKLIIWWYFCCFCFSSFHRFKVRSHWAFLSSFLLCFDHSLIRQFFDRNLLMRKIHFHLEFFESFLFFSSQFLYSSDEFPFCLRWPTIQLIEHLFRFSVSMRLKIDSVFFFWNFCFWECVLWNFIDFGQSESGSIACNWKKITKSLLESNTPVEFIAWLVAGFGKKQNEKKNKRNKCWMDKSETEMRKSQKCIHKCCDWPNTN